MILLSSYQYAATSAAALVLAVALVVMLVCYYVAYRAVNIFVRIWRMHCLLRRIEKRGNKVAILGPNDPRAIRTGRQPSKKLSSVIAMIREAEEAEEVRKLNEENGYGTGYSDAR